MEPGHVDMAREHRLPILMVPCTKRDEFTVLDQRGNQPHLYLRGTIREIGLAWIPLETQEKGITNKQKIFGEIGEDFGEMNAILGGGEERREKRAGAWFLEYLCHVIHPQLRWELANEEPGKKTIASCPAVTHAQREGLPVGDSKFRDGASAEASLTFCTAHNLASSGDSTRGQ
jgi:hypothetical protein